mmetsp:Transcript_1343/g.2143  ORF Transcript_1343/g.2143 Transcript_1343/m.2143 type:complete len:645 (+) Transcript_1343:109-2043(+)|eukprot:CAMPEP_0119107684 /NCGR_PEP_ID=MMETSP1180-20130426/11537_1 /TAXON_ID=3052 ORGANISM="Chlamydomonas cf sp, Strain CCMP681" /NCGR_SAMPLE_ID=MMETSP1180 /ASSEMBLY_ACC=CAM_ASM_000741 /LENGTH=644 /DNA_ID=CAMNT_0007093203 /DNA_START=109 /DNA_END=2043 /DNA_ORIENTATION=+
MAPGAFGRAFGFTSGKEYLEASIYNKEDGFMSYPRMLTRRVFKTKTLESMAENARASMGNTELKRTLDWKDLSMLGVGFMCGAGIFVTPGRIAVNVTGPAVFISYMLAAISAFLSSFCYAEFTANMPMAGAAYNYTYATLGEFTAWIVVANLILSYILANAAVARSFAPYLALLFNKPVDFFIKFWAQSGAPGHGGYFIDGWALAICFINSCILSMGMKESVNVNNVITVVHIVIMLFVIIAGLTKADKKNFSPFIKPGASWRSVFTGASQAFFSFIGFDALASTAEEMKDPATDMPRGIIGAVSIVTIIYVLMCVTLSLMVPLEDIQTNATFAAAFDYVGMTWAKYIVSIGALLGIFTGTLIGIMGAARILAGCARERMFPPGIATISQKLQVPWVSTWIIGMCSGGIALFAGFGALANMVSIGILLVFYVVAVSLLCFRCNVHGVTTTKNQILLILHTLAIMGFSMGFTMVWVLPIYSAGEDYYVDYEGTYLPPVPVGPWQVDQYKWLIAMFVLTIASTVSFTIFVKQDNVPVAYKLPLFPAIPAASIFVNTFLLGQLDVASYVKFGWWTCSIVGLYLVYGCVAQEAHDRREKELCLPSSDSGSRGKADLEVATSAKLAYEFQDEDVSRSLPKVQPVDISSH